MLAGQYEAAWREADLIRARGAPDEHRVWDGEPLVDRRVMIRSVHGFGDAIQMLRYARLVRQEAARVTLQVAPSLVPLAPCFRGVDEVVCWGEERDFDAQLEITELPYIYRSTLASLPTGAGSLQLPAAARTEAATLLGARSALRVGLVWSSSGWDASRSVPFHLLRPLLHIKRDLEFWSLQPSAPEWDTYCRTQAWPLRRAGDYPAILFAACIAEMDLVITTDSFAAHLAGTLGRPTWVLLKQQADWRWLIAREDSPWYPSLRLFRQLAQGDWPAVIERVVAELIAWQPPPAGRLTAATGNLGVTG